MRSTLSVFDYGLILASLLIAIAGQFLLKWGMSVAVGDKGVGGVGQMVSRSYAWTLLTTWQVVAALAIYALGAFLWMAVLSRMPVSAAYPFLGLSYVFVLLIDVAFNGAAITWTKALGTALVVAGVYLVGRQ
jgi:drug/metabolite transporter (DMT)-like permease